MKNLKSIAALAMSLFMLAPSSLFASSHREAAFAAASFLMDYLKTRAPFWKQVEAPSETAAGKEAEAKKIWVEAKASDDAAAGRWSAPAPGRQAAKLK